MACLFGHKWDGCRCVKCGRTRDEGHVYTWKPGNVCSGTCIRCHTTKLLNHDFQPVPGQCYQVCSRCGKQTEAAHDFVNVLGKCARVCANCGEEEPADQVRHVFVSVPGQCRQICSVCGKEGGIVHTWKPVEGKCEEKCAVCGETREAHDLVNGVCTRCGYTDRQAVMDDCLARLLAIFPRTPLDYEGHRAFDTAHRDEVRAIGERLNALNGMRAMRQVGEAFARELPIHARKLETTWDGIGNWLG